MIDPFRSRSAVLCAGGVVASSQPLATAVGTGVLDGGGNAVDACIAAAAALGVTEPCSTGIGGDCFALVFEASTGEIHGINGSGRSPAGLSLERAQAQAVGGRIPALHALTVTVPGACAAWFDLSARFGTLSMSELLAPATDLAAGGFAVAPVTAHFWAEGVHHQLSRDPGGEGLLINGRAPEAGERFVNSGLARTYREIAAGGAEAFYEGPVAQAIVEVVRAHGGVLARSDLRSHRSSWVDPISVVYRGARVWECPPNGQGLAALMALNILSGFDLSSMDPLGPQRLHIEIEAMRLAFADARWYISDPAHHQIPIEGLLSREHADRRRALIDPSRANLDATRGVPMSSSDTVYLCAVDRLGNACSFIGSNYMGFGTGLVPRGWGFTLQNRGAGFCLERGHPNIVAPKKRPYHTIIPGMLTRESDGSLMGPFGVMGGFMQPQGHVQVVTALMDDGLDPQAALDRPRFCIEDGRAGGRVGLEVGIDGQTLRSLAHLGHPVYPVSGWARHLFGRGQVIQRRGDGFWWAGSDHRADGCAMMAMG